MAGWGDGVASHSHDFGDLHGVAEVYHRHHDEESRVTGLREDLGHLQSDVLDAREMVGELRSDVGDNQAALARIDHTQARLIGVEQHLADAMTGLLVRVLAIEMHFDLSTDDRYQHEMKVAASQLAMNSQLPESVVLEDEAPLAGSGHLGAAFTIDEGPTEQQITDWNVHNDHADSVTDTEE